ncbi:hypothetical protein [Moraxella lacunata]
MLYFSPFGGFGWQNVIKATDGGKFSHIFSQISFIKKIFQFILQHHFRY